MARQSTISNEQILQAARKLFLERGFEVTTAEIARAAGVSEGSIFRRFATKQELFIAAMGLDCAATQRWFTALEDRVGEGTVVDNLTDLVAGAIDFFRDHMPRMMLLWSARELPNPHKLMRQHGDVGPRRAVVAVADYIAAEIALGRLRANNATVLARVLIGAAAHYVFLETVGTLPDELDPRAYARELTQTIWEGVAPPPQQPKSR